jgi:hypothetical protein
MANEYLILTNKDGQFHTELCDGLHPVEHHDYFFYGKRRARFVIAELVRPVKIPIVEEGTPPLRNLVPSKFFPRFATLEAARKELEQLVNFGHLDVRLVRVDADESPSA